MNLDWKKEIDDVSQERFKAAQANDVQSFRWADYDFNYRAEHTQLVTKIGIEIGTELDADMDVLTAALILHDIGRSKEEKIHGKIGAHMAEEILRRTDFPVAKIEAVRYAIAAHVGWGGSAPETLEACIVWDADKLSKLGATIIVHRLMRMPLKGKRSVDALPEFNHWIKQAEYIKKNMKTRPGKRIAEDRYRILQTFVAALNREMSL